MPILAYCVSLAQDYLGAPRVGVAGAPVFDLESPVLRAWYSEVEEGTFSGADHVTRAALEFHHFISTMFREGTVLPFRFPTILESVDELNTHLEEKGAWYCRALRHSEGLAQFDARISNRTKPAAEAATGTAYLEQRRAQHVHHEDAVASLLQGVGDYVREHHVKETPQGSRVYLLVERSRLPEFREAAGRIAVPDGVEIRLTGPWPPTEFLPSAEDEP